MADKYLSQTGLSYYHNRLKNQFADKGAFDTLAAEVDEIVAEGGEPNVIEVVKKNGTALQVDSSDKSVNVTVPTTVAELTDHADYALAADIPTKVSDLTNDGDGTQGSAFATEDYVDQNGGKIDTISVNGTQQTITNKNVNITVPTVVSDLTNDSGYQTASDVSTAIGTAVASAYKYKGSVASQSNLPASGNTTGDVYDVQDTGMNYAWNGSAWDALGQYVDTSLFWAKADLVAITTAEIDALFA